MCDTTETKVCMKCNQEKPLDSFFGNNSRKDGKAVWCKECFRTYQNSNGVKQSRKKIHDAWQKSEAGLKFRFGGALKAIERKRRVKQKEKRMISAARIRAKKKGLEVSITEDDITIPTICPVLGIEITKENRRASDTSATIDRIDNNKGYIRGNVLIISYRANSIKRDGSMDELYKIYHYMRKYQVEDYSI